jgi:hypothetical protein
VGDAAVVERSLLDKVQRMARLGSSIAIVSF